jgi:hypothetical protein
VPRRKVGLLDCAPVPAFPSEPGGSGRYPPTPRPLKTPRQEERADRALATQAGVATLRRDEGDSLGCSVMAERRTAELALIEGLVLAVAWTLRWPA